VSWLEALLDAAALLAAVGTALLVDLGGARRLGVPPGFARPWRRALAATVLSLLFYLALFQPLAALGRSEPADIMGQPLPVLFAGHGLMLLAVLGWAALAFGGGGGGPFSQRAGRALGLAAARPGEELALGLLGGAAAWVGMVILMLALGSLLAALGGEDLVPRKAPQLVAWMAGLPVAVRVALSLSAGVAEELLFRGLLQPRVGAALATVLFVLAHGVYEQPLMLVGLTWVSLVFATLVGRHGTVWPAMVAHALFDLIQLLVVIPWLLERMPALSPAIDLP
jgi:membrane protease YdiL (CAAX protease family)